MPNFSGVFEARCAAPRRLDQPVEPAATYAVGMANEPTNRELWRVSDALESRARWLPYSKNVWFMVHENRFYLLLPSLFGDGLKQRLDEDPHVRLRLAGLTHQNVATSLLTSLEPAVHGLDLEGDRLAESVPGFPPDGSSMAEILRDNGYRTLAVTAGGGVGEVYGFARGFDRFHQPAGRPAYVLQFVTARSTARTVAGHAA